MIKKLAWKEIDLSSLLHNLSVIKDNVGDNVEIIPVVKADAYGHGAIIISRFLSKYGIKRFAVALLEEGIELRKAGIKEQILVLTPQFKDAIPYLIKYNLTPVISSIDFFEELGRFTYRRNIPFSFHVSVDTGMGREGLLEEDLDSFITIWRKYSHLTLEGLSSHLSSSENKEDKYNEKQLEIFDRVYSKLREIGWEGISHVANSGGIWNFPKAFYNAVRPGIALYGYGMENLKPVMSVHAKITLIKRLPEGWGVGYNHTYTTTKETLIALIPVGYADGYRRELSNKSFVIIKNKKFPVIGRISMDQTIIDISSDPYIRVGDEVIVMGRSESHNIDAEVIAKMVGTIPYEILTGFGMAKRLGNIYINDSSLVLSSRQG